MSTLTGQDSVDPNGMQDGHDVYCGYDAGAPGYAGGSYSNMDAIKARFPGKKYLSVGRDAIDIEPGLAGPGDAPGFIRGWTQVNTNKPVVYANGSTMPAVESAIAAAGIARDKYYLWVAEWDGSPGLPAGFDGKQYASTSGYDSDSFADYMFGPPVPFNPYPDLAEGDTGPAVVALQDRLIAWGAKIAADGAFGPNTLAAVKAFETAERLPADGKVTKDDWAVLKSTPVKPPPPVPKGDYGPPVNLKAGSVKRFTEVSLSWGQPGTAGLPPASEFLVYVYQGLGASKADLVPGFPVTVPVENLDITVPSGHPYVIHVVAGGIDGKGIAPLVFARLDISV